MWITRWKQPVFLIKSFEVIHSYTHLGDKLVDKCVIPTDSVNYGTETVN